MDASTVRCSGHGPTGGGSGDDQGHTGEPTSQDPPKELEKVAREREVWASLRPDLWVGKCCNEMFIRDVLDYPNYASIPTNMSCIPELETLLSERVRAFLDWLQDNRAFSCILHVIKDDTSANATFFQHLVEDRPESGSSYCEFLQYIQQQVS